MPTSVLFCAISYTAGDDAEFRDEARERAREQTFCVVAWEINPFRLRRNSRAGFLARRGEVHGG